MRRVVLASGSAIRNRLLASAGVQFEAIAADIDESVAIEESLAANASWEQIAIKVSEAKAQAVSQREAGAIVIGSDQLMVAQGQLLRKAASLEEAAARLKALVGETHHLVSGVALVEDGRLRWSYGETVAVRMRLASETVIDDYCARRGAGLLASVSCYEIEGEGAQLLEAVEGDLFSALGLPLFPTLAGLRQAGALAE